MQFPRKYPYLKIRFAFLLGALILPFTAPKDILASSKSGTNPLLNATGGPCRNKPILGLPSKELEALSKAYGNPHRFPLIAWIKDFMRDQLKKATVDLIS